MANILLTQKCNQQCPYCFASYTEDKSYMSMDAFDTIIRFLAKTPKEKIGLLGGEPLLHPDFSTICKKLTDNQKVNAVVIYTNGLLLHKYIDLLNEQKYALLINCNEYDFYNPQVYDKLENNIRMAVRKLSTKNVLLGLNIYKSFMNIDRLIDLLKELDMHKLRMSLAIPNEDIDISHKKRYDILKDELFRILEKLAIADVVPQFDCNKIPICYYSKSEIEQLNNLFGKRIKQTNLLKLDYTCKPVIDIYPDMSVCRCFGRTDIRRHLSEFMNIDDIRKYFFNKIDKYCFDEPIFESCKTCYLSETMNCNGGCLSYRVFK